ncbi:small GTPase superfamily [Scheffersomyces coipomensis]|uniref:small GTPase superfamily n=1 Tax=Scheffersomyces coipomensis TaxID=1788519 RepID=UPI00315D6471
MPLCGSTPQIIQRKIVILGDGACGKTSLLNVFTTGYFPQVYEPTVFENYVHDIFIDNKSVQLSLWDTAGQEEFDRLRSLSYADTHCIMLCFSIDSPDSLENVQSKWVGEITDHCEGVKLVLVALKCDLRSHEDSDLDIANNNINNNNNNRDEYNPYQSSSNPYQQNNNNSHQPKRLITYEEGLAVAKRIGALRYLECSAKKKRGVNEAFSEAARCALTAKPKGANENEPEKKGCVIM